METIELFKDDNQWVAKFSDPQAAEIMGTDTIPTPFNISVPVEMVVQKIRQRNPGVHVWVK